MKPFRGVIHQWRKVFVEAPIEAYGPNLGFVVYGCPQGHGRFQDWLRTSLVVWIDDHETVIETLNSRYDLGEPYSGDNNDA